MPDFSKSSEEELDFAELRQRVAVLEESVATLMQKLKIESDRRKHSDKKIHLVYEEQSRELHAWLAALSNGLDTSSIKIRRFIPLRVYLAEFQSHQPELLVQELKAILQSIGFTISDEFDAIKASWFKKMFAGAKEAITHDEVLKRLGTLERAFVLKGIGQPQAEIDERQATGVAKIIESLSGTPNAALQVGSLLILKVTHNEEASIQVKTLSQRELQILEMNQELLTSPRTIFGELRRLQNVIYGDHCPTVNASEDGSVSQDSACQALDTNKNRLKELGIKPPISIEDKSGRKRDG